jgi:biopolymer transport protein ExbB
MKFNLHRCIYLFLFTLMCFFLQPSVSAQMHSNEAISSSVSGSKERGVIADTMNSSLLSHEGLGIAPNPYGLEALWFGSDLVAKTVLIVLLIMSCGSWYITVVKLLTQAKMARQARAAQIFWSAATVVEGTQALELSSPFRYMADAANKAVQKHEGLMSHIPVNDWLAMSIQRAVERINNNAQGGLAFLATVGSISPFVGLFGTVWGIYHALTAIGISGQASIDKVAGPVGESLIMTAIGLAVAVPAVLAYNWLIRRNKAVLDEVRAFGSDLHAVMLSTIKA